MPSVSIANLLVTFLGFPSTVTMILMFMGFFVVGYWFRRRLPDKERMLFDYSFGLSAFFVSYQQVWDSQLVYLFPFIAAWFSVSIKNDRAIKSLGLSVLLIPIIMELFIMISDFGSKLPYILIAPILLCVFIPMQVNYFNLSLHTPNMAGE